MKWWEWLAAIAAILWLLDKFKNASGAAINGVTNQIPQMQSSLSGLTDPLDSGPILIPADMGTAGFGFSGVGSGGAGAAGGGKGTGSGHGGQVSTQ